MILTLNQLTAGRQAVIIKLNLDKDILYRLASFGLIPGKTVQLKRIAPLGGPLVLQIGATSFLLRRTLAVGIQVAFT